MHKADIPLVFFAIAFFIVILGLFSKYSFRSAPLPKVQQGMQEGAAKTGEAGPQLDYNQPIVCETNDKSSSLSAYLSGNDLTVTITNSDKTTSSYLVNGDCLYTWTSIAPKTGTKKCGVGSYISLGRQLLSSGLATPDIFEDAMKQANLPLAAEIPAILKSCKNKTKSGKNLFSVPAGILFQQK